MEEKTTIATSQATGTAATVEETSAEETAAATTASQAECVLPTVDNSMVADNSMATDNSAEAGTPHFTIPLSSLDSINKMAHLIGELYTYSYLINKSTGATDPALFIDSRMCDDLAEAISLEEFLTLMKEFITATDYVKGIELKKDQLVFTCFESLTDPEMKQAAASLFRLISASITEKTNGGKRLNLHKVQIKQPENEKFAFRSWLTKLDWKGAEGKMERNLLYKNLTGNTAFCTEESKIRWEAKHKKGRKAGGQTEATVMGTSEAVSTAEEESDAETTVAETEVEVAEAVAV